VVAVYNRAMMYPAGNRESVTYPNGTCTVYAFDVLHRLTDLVNKRDVGDGCSAYAGATSSTGKQVSLCNEGTAHRTVAHLS
jgi:hypothetical protein